MVINNPYHSDDNPPTGLVTIIENVADGISDIEFQFDGNIFVLQKHDSAEGYKFYRATNMNILRARIYWIDLIKAGFKRVK